MKIKDLQEQLQRFYPDDNIQCGGGGGGTENFQVEPCNNGRCNAQIITAEDSELHNQVRELEDDVDALEAKIESATEILQEMKIDMPEGADKDTIQAALEFLKP